MGAIDGVDTNIISYPYDGINLFKENEFLFFFDNVQYWTSLQVFNYVKGLKT